MKLLLFKFTTKQILCISLLFLSTTFIMSCGKDIQNFKNLTSGKLNTIKSTGANVSVPLIHSKLTLHDMLKRGDTLGFLTEDAAHLLSLVYKTTVYSQTAEQAIPVNVQNNSNSYSFNIPPALFPVGTTFTWNRDTTFQFATANSERFDSIYLKSGTMNFGINSTLNESADIQVMVPACTKNGVVFKKTIHYVYNGTSPVVVNSVFDLSGYILRFGANNMVNVLFSVISPITTPTNNTPYNITFSESITNLKFSKIFGYLGQRNFNLLMDTVAFDIFKNGIGGSYYLDDPRLKILISNSLGMPMRVNFNSLTAHSTTTAPYYVSISGSGLPNPLNVVAPTIPNIGHYAVTPRISLDKTNSNLAAAFNIAPKELIYNVGAQSNPAGSTTNFAVDTSRIKMDLEMEIPLAGKLGNFVLQDTSDFSFGDSGAAGGAMGDIEYMLFRVNILNGFPVDVNFQIYFVDDQYRVLDSLLSASSLILQSGIVGPAPDYKVIQPGSKMTDLVLNESRVSRISNCKHLIERSSFSTTNQGSQIVKIYSDYYIDFRLGFQFQLKNTVHLTPGK